MMTHWRVISLTSLLLIILNGFSNALAVAPTSSTNLPAPQQGTSVTYVTDIVPITFYAPFGSGQTPTYTCPSSALSPTPIQTSTFTNIVYDQTLTQRQQVQGYTCNMLIAHYSTQTTTAYLSSLGVPTSPTGVICPTKLYQSPNPLSCYQGTLSLSQNGSGGINQFVANTSVCYTPMPTAVSPYCTGIPQAGSPGYYVGVHYVFNNPVASGITLSTGSKTVQVPACNATLLLSLPGNTTFNFTYTENVGFWQSYDGTKTTIAACTCNSLGSPANNTPANSSCVSSPGWSITAGVKNQIAINQNGGALNFLTDSVSSPFLYLYAPVCVVQAPNSGGSYP